MASDERLYRSEEMLYGMVRLLAWALWLEVPEIDAVIEGPLVSTESERSGNMITDTDVLSHRYT